MIKYSVKLILWQDGKAIGPTYPIYVRITINGKRSYISTKHSVNQAFWDEKNEMVRAGHPLASQINDSITIAKHQIVKKILEFKVSEKPVTASLIKAIFTSVDLTNIFEFADDFIKEVKHKREASTLENYRKHLKRLELFHGSRILHFEEITHAYLRRYEEHLREDVETNYISALWKTLKLFFNAAKKRKIIDCYPFETYENPAYEAPDKDYLTNSDLQKWENYVDETQNPYHRQAGIYFLLGCYSGLRVSDWWQFDPKKHIVGDRIRLRARKNGGYVSMQISKPLRRNLERMELVKLTSDEQVINRNLKAIAKKLDIDKKLTTHTGRHTFAVTICLGNRISSETAAELMGITLQTFVNNYSQVTEEKIDRETFMGWSRLT